MAAIKYYIVILVAVTGLEACKKIKILSDFSTSQDKEFFKTTFPWIVDNVGSGVRAEFFFKDGQVGGKRMCVLDNLKRNLYLQAQYLKCEADGENNCIKSLPLDQWRLDRCYSKINKIIRAAEKQFRKYGTNETPLIVNGRSRQTVQDPMAVLLNICGIFGRKQPPGCRTPSKIPQKSSTATSTSPTTPTPTQTSSQSFTQLSTQESTVFSTSLSTVSVQPETGPTIPERTESTELTSSSSEPLPSTQSTSSASSSSGESTTNSAMTTTDSSTTTPPIG